jgi:hypothetical protein
MPGSNPGMTTLFEFSELRFDEPREPICVAFDQQLLCPRLAALRSA